METPELRLPDYEKLLDLTRSDAPSSEVEEFLDQFLKTPLFHQLQVFNNQAVRIMETVELKYLFVSDSMLELTGYTAKEISEGGLMFTYRRVHAADIFRLTVATYKIRKALHKLSPEDKLKARFSYDLRFKCKDGTVKHILQNCHILKLSSTSEPLILLFASTDITPYKSDDRMNYSLSVFEEGKGFQFILNDCIAEACPLSVRELEVLAMTSHGHSEKEIAARLHLSPSTIKTHRRNMLQKMDAKNSIELVRVAIARKWI